jgi:hypothetical protein
MTKPFSIMQQTAIPYLKSAARLAALVILTVLTVCPQRMQAQGTAFSYQGKLTDGGSPATGTYDFQVTVYDAVSGGNGVGSVLTMEDVAVTGGLFTLYPDFGGGVFTGPARWLEVAVRAGNSTGGFTTLTPRQPVLTTPYAQRALVAAGVPNASISSAQLAAGAVGTTQIANGSITAEKLASGVGGGGGSGSSTPMGAIVGGFAEDEEDLLAGGFTKVPGLFTQVGGWNKLAALSMAPDFSSFDSAWTGTEWFCLGQFAPGGAVSFGYGESFAYLPARFNPSTGLWTQANTNNGPQFMSAGSGIQLIVGGAEIYAFGQVDSIQAPLDAFGWRYNTGTGTWTMISTNGLGRFMNGAPSGPSYVWAGSKLFAIGQPSSFTPEEPIRVGLYDPNTASWSLPSTTPVTKLSLTTKPVVALAGSEVVVYGKDSLDFEKMVAARLNPATGQWSAMSTNNGPQLSTMGNPRPVWTGTELFVEGRTNEASSQPVYFLYNPQTDSWRKATAIGSPQAGFIALNIVATVWTGTEVGVVYVNDDPFNKTTYVALYNPVTDAWRTFTDNFLIPDTVPGMGGGPKGIWRDGEMLVLGKFKEYSTDSLTKLLNYRFAPPRLVYLFQKQPIE